MGLCSAIIWLSSRKENGMYDKKKLAELKDSLGEWEETSLQKTIGAYG